MSNEKLGTSSFHCAITWKMKYISWVLALAFYFLCPLSSVSCSRYLTLWLPSSRASMHFRFVLTFRSRSRRTISSIVELLNDVIAVLEAEEKPAAPWEEGLLKMPLFCERGWILKRNSRRCFFPFAWPTSSTAGRFRLAPLPPCWLLSIVASIWSSSDSVGFRCMKRNDFTSPTSGSSSVDEEESLKQKVVIDSV